MKPDVGEPPSLGTPLPASPDAQPHSTGRDDKPWRPANVFVSFVHAADGIAQTFRAERNFRFHCVAALAVVIAGFALHLPPLRFVAVLLAIAFVLVAELFNTATEAAVDLFCPAHHPLAKRAKDAAAGAVLVAAVVAALVGGIVFLPAFSSALGVRVSVPIIAIAGLSVVVLLAASRLARRHRAASGTSKDLFRRTVIGVGLVAFAASTGYRMAQVVGAACTPCIFASVDTCTPPLPLRPALLFDGGVP